ncbi:MAG: undecaprenyldiphospho-muramoylpentapeptide beta-N-acetylglucosaminyltransferase [Deltaproteobacteria bacterium]|nr:undecaprenyldiphospho-muramoylpentapeptide beta-N-acetylglucosaminyltransferase [Deltaproteobacteria bacterium]
MTVGANKESLFAKNMRIVIAAGGTGGHLFPGIAVAREFQARQGAEVTFLTAPKSVTAQILERYGFAWEAVSAEALKGQGLLGRLRSLLKIPGSIRQARTRLLQLKPRLVLGMGGYASGPVGVAAWRLGIPLALHEQNAIPGTTNAWLAKVARRIFVSFPVTRSYLPTDKVVWTGNPIREEFFQKNAERPERPFTVLVTGGSQGAHHLNMETLRALPLLEDIKEQLHFLHLTGDADFPEVEAGYRERGWAAEVAAFSREMPELMGRAHLVVSRAGASTLAELAAVGRAAILVPYPFAANNHQEFNARFLAEAGAGEIILNKDFTGALLAGKIRELMSRPQKREAMEAAARRLAKPDAAKEIVAGCLNLIKSSF